MRILVIGQAGQLSLSLAEQAVKHSGLSLITVGRPELDLERPEALAAGISSRQPDLVVNAAAYTAVDKAETDPEKAYAINRDGAAAAARVARQLGIPFIHISTDYVFDGRKSQPYSERDETGPLNVYGRSKLEGEYAVAAAHPGALILRTSWVFSPFGNNFVKTMMKLGSERPVLRIVGDQHGNPTSALDLADAILALAPRLQLDSGGIYHLSGQGSTSWYGFARTVFEEYARHDGPCPFVEAISSVDYKAAATRPMNSRLDCRSFVARFGIALRPWTEAVAETVGRLASR